MKKIKSFDLIAEEYKDIAKNYLFEIDNDDIIKERMRNSRFLVNRQKTKPNETIIVSRQEYIDKGKKLIQGDKNTKDVFLYVYYPRNFDKNKKYPTIYFIHGGGYVMGMARENEHYHFSLANENEVIVVCLEYTLATEYPFPADINDAYIGLSYIFDNADNLNIDKKKIILYGESAGGGLCARLSLLIRDRKEYNIIGQFLLFPMLDYRTGSESSLYNSEYIGEFSWTKKSNQFCWNKLMGDTKISKENISYFSPALEKDVSGLPETVIVVGTLDLFVCEDIDFANRLIRAGVSTELYVERGVFHNYIFVGDLIGASQSKRFYEFRKKTIKRMIKKII